jgi:isochorismate synthase
VISLLTYRFPNKEIETCFGNFKETIPSEIEKGFIVSNFDGSKCFVFEERDKNNEPIAFFEGQKKPYVMTAREYYLQAHELLNGLNLMQMEKAVFTRVKSVPFSIHEAEKLFQILCSTYPAAFVYLFSDKKLGTWIGASPEILVEAHKGFAFTTALAGTKLFKEDEWGEKEIHEQAVVTDYIVSVSKRLKLKNIETQGPYDFQAGPITHLKTDISVDLNSVLAWDFARKLHPTPAVSGVPKNQAISLIESVEPHDRELYTGMIGFVSPESTKIYVNLRCAQLFEKQAYLYLGGGYTMQSIPELEWVETENKSKTLLQCIQKI